MGGPAAPRRSGGAGLGRPNWGGCRPVSFCSGILNWPPTNVGFRGWSVEVGKAVPMIAPWHVLLLLMILAFWIAPVIVGAQIGSRKGHQALGLMLGLLLGWIGVIIIALVRPAQTWPPQRYSGWPPQQGGWPPQGQTPWPGQHQQPAPPPYGQQPWPGQQPGWPPQDQRSPDAQ